MRVLFVILTVGWAFFEARAAAQGFSFSTPAGMAGQPGTADGTNNVARFDEPGGVAVDAGGSIFVADTANHTIRRITRSGTRWVTRTIAGSAGQQGTNDGSNASARFYLPFGITVDGGGNVYVADTYNHTIRKLVVTQGTNWVVTTLAGKAAIHGSADGTGDSAAFYYPSGIAADQAGWVYVADAYNHVIRRISPGGDVETISGTAGVAGIVNGTNGSAQFYYPSGIAVAPNGNLFVADTFNSLIRKITLQGADWVVTTLAGLPRFPGGADGVNRTAQFNYPFGICVANSGIVYVADTVNDTIRAVTPAGPDWVVTTMGGLASSPGSNDGPGQAARFFNPYGVAVDGAGNLIVADSYNDTIRLGEPRYLLSAMRLPGQIVLSWPVAAANYVLETSSTLAAGSTWTQLSGAVISGSNYVKTNAVAPGRAFFRLRSQ